MNTEHTHHYHKAWADTLDYYCTECGVKLTTDHLNNLETSLDAMAQRACYLWHHELHETDGCPAEERCRALDDGDAAQAPAGGAADAD